MMLTRSKAMACLVLMGAVSCGGPGAFDTLSAGEGLRVQRFDKVVQVLDQTNLVSDQEGVAEHTDPNLVNAWGLAFNPTAGVAWVSDNGTGLASVFDSAGNTRLTVQLPPNNAPTGQVFNADRSAFLGDFFIIASEDGTITGWQPTTGAQTRVDNSASGAVYKGIAIAFVDGRPQLYAADFHNNRIDVFDSNFQPVTPSGCECDEKKDQDCNQEEKKDEEQGLIWLARLARSDARHGRHHRDRDRDRDRKHDEDRDEGKKNHEDDGKKNEDNDEGKKNHEDDGKKNEDNDDGKKNHEDDGKKNEDNDDGKKHEDDDEKGEECQPFVDNDLPPNFAPFNIFVHDNLLYVAYALQKLPDRHDDQPGPGNGFIDVYDAQGRLLRRLISRGALNSPWGMAFAPDNFGNISGALLVGNFGNGRINVYRVEDEEKEHEEENKHGRRHHRDHDGKKDEDRDEARFLGTIGSDRKTPLVIDGLWSIAFGPGTGGFNTDTLWFTAGPDDEMHGLFGRLDLPACQNH